MYLGDFLAADPYAVLLCKPMSELDAANLKKFSRHKFGIVIAEI
jgi:ABC-type uncharacterized transport system YnjBCD ATPase subunit